MKILVCCFGNTCRSPMMAALLQRELESCGTSAKVESAGLVKDADGRSASENAQTVMQELGLDVSTHRSRDAAKLDLTIYDRIYVVEEKLIEPLVAASADQSKIELLCSTTGGVPNPFKQGIDVYRQCAAALAVEARRIASQIA